MSDDNAFAETIFRTCKYRPNYLNQGFADITETREWVLQVVHWYNHQHKHSGQKFISPIERHAGLDEQILQQRGGVFKEARARNPNRWSGKTRNWAIPDAVCQNPEKEHIALANTG